MALMRSEIESTAQMMRAAHVAQAASVSSMHSGFLYNCLQDLKAILVVECRSAQSFAEAHIRDSVRMDSEWGVAGTLYSEFRSAVADSGIEADRIFFLDEASESLDQSPIFPLASAVQKSGVYRKVYFLKGGFRAFHSQYPFLCVPDPAPDSLYLPARARYPTEVLAKSVYLGGVVHLTNARHLRKLGFKTLIDCGTGVTAKMDIPEIHLEMSADREIDFEAAVKVIDESEKPVFLYCLNGDALSAAVASAYFSHVKRIRSEHALAYVVSKRPGISLPPEVFLQLQNYGKESTAPSATVEEVFLRLGGQARISQE